MEARLEKLLKKIGYNEEMIPSFNKAKLDKIIVIEDKNTWNIHIKNKTNFKYIELKTFLDKLKEYTNNKYTYTLEIETENEDLALYEDYYKNILILINNNNLFFDMFKDRLIKEKNNYFIEVYNKAEELTLNKKIKCIQNYYKNFGYKTLPNIKLNEEKGIKIKEEINELNQIDNEKLKTFINQKSEEPIQKQNTYNNQNTFKKGTNFNNKTYTSKRGLFGEVKGNITKLNDINYELDNIVVEVQIFGIIPSTKKGFNSLTLKVTDLSTSMYLRIFARSEEEYEELLGKFKEGMWLRIAGYVKNSRIRKKQ